MIASIPVQLYRRLHLDQLPSGWWIAPSLPFGVFLWVLIIRAIVGWLL